MVGQATANLTNNNKDRIKTTQITRHFISNKVKVKENFTNNIPINPISRRTTVGKAAITLAPSRTRRSNSEVEVLKHLGRIIIWFILLLVNFVSG